MDKFYIHKSEAPLMNNENVPLEYSQTLSNSFIKILMLVYEIYSTKILS